MTLLVHFVVVVAVVGILWYLINNVIPMPQPARVVVTVIFCLLACFYLLGAFGVVDFSTVRVLR